MITILQNATRAWNHRACELASRDSEAETNIIEFTSHIMEKQDTLLTRLGPTIKARKLLLNLFINVLRKIKNIEFFQ